MNKCITPSLALLAGALYAVMAVLQFHYGVSIFPHPSQFWDASVSWQNKYENTLTLQLKTIMGIVIPVLFTDGWHLMQSLFLIVIFISVISFKRITKYLLFDFLLLRGLFGVSFYVFYNYILIK